MRGNHVLKIVAHSSPPLSAVPGFRQYDFFVDGQSFFLFPKVFRLGLAPGDPRGNGPPPSATYNNYSLGAGPSRPNPNRSSGIISIEAPHNPDEEEAYFQEALKNSLMETSAAKQAVSQEGRDLLLDFFDDNSTVRSAPAPAPLAIAAQPFGAPDYGQSYGASVAPAYAVPPAYGAPAPAPPAYSNYSVSAPAAPYAPVAPSYPPEPNYGAAAPLALPGPAPAFAALPAPAAADPWGAPAPATPWAVPAPAVPMTPSYGAPPAPSNPWETQAPAPAFASPSGTAGYGSTNAPTAAVQFTNPPPQPTPSSVGFASPQSNGFASQGYEAAPNFAAAPTQEFAQPAPTYSDPTQTYSEYDTPVPEPAAPTTDPALFTMSTLSGEAEAPAPSNSRLSLADQAYAKYATLGEFDLVSKKEPARENPFASAPVGSTVSLAEMKAKIAKPEAKKPVMNSPMSMAPHQGALVMHGTQQGNNWGQQVQQPTYGQQPAFAQQPAPPAYGQPPPAYGQPPPTYGQPPPAYGQPPQAYGQPPTQQPPAPLQQPSFGQAYGQPPAQQNPFGGFGGQQQF